MRTPFATLARTGLLLGMLISTVQAAAPLLLEGFEFADSTVNAQAGVSAVPFGTGNAATFDSATGAVATQGTYALRADVSFGSDAFNDIRITRVLAAPVTPAPALTLAALSACRIRLDLQGDVNLGDKNLFVFLVDADGEKFRFISNSDASVNSGALSTDHVISFFDADPFDGVQTDDVLTQIASVQVLLQDNTTGAVPAESGTFYVDNLRLELPASNFRTITPDGEISDWTGINPLITDLAGDGGAGRDVKAIYLANDATNLYVRIESYNADAFDGNEYSGIDGDANAATGFNLFGLGFGSDSLIAGASVFGETTGNFNSGGATSGGVAFGPFIAATDIEFAIALNMTIPGDIAQSFPGGIGSIIKFAYGDGNATDTVPPTGYQLAAAPVNIFRAITIDGDISDWADVPVAITDPSGDGGTGRDLRAIYLANNGTMLFIRFESYNSDAFDGNELIGIDGDNSAATGFNLFGGGIGSDTLLGGATAYGETTGNFNSGGATPSGVSFGPFTASTDIELAVDLSTTIPGDIAQSFPGGLGSTIRVIIGDSNGGATDVIGPVSYTLTATVPVELSSFDLE